MTDPEVKTPLGFMPVYLAVPASDPPWPGVVVVHDFTGMSTDLRAQADWLAGEGFLAIAPDLYHWGGRLRCLRTIMGDLGRRRGRTFDDLKAAQDWIVDHPGCTGTTGVIGFCMGGGYAIALAPGNGYSAASVNYGGCPIVGSFGETDRSPLGRSAGVRMERVLTGLGVEHDVKIYPGVGHGFMNDHDPADMTPLLRLLARVSGTRHDPAAAADARRRIVAFFDTHLRSRRGP